MVSKNWIEGGMVVIIVGSYCCKRKMLDETEETRGFFCYIFVIGDISIGGRAPPQEQFFGLHLISGKKSSIFGENLFLVFT